MIPPRYAKTASLTNHTDHPVVVTATFGSDAQAAEGNEKITQKFTLGPTQTRAFEQQEYDMGGWTAVAALESFTVQAADANGGLSAAHHTPTVDAIVDTLHVEIHPDSTGTYRIAVTKQD